jgi:two-component system, sensor histidine kinase and response regulator
MNLKQLIFRDEAKAPANTSKEENNLFWEKSTEPMNSDMKLKKRVLELEAINTRLLKRLEKLSKEHADYVQANSRLISILSHDLRSPFITIMSVMEILKGHISNNNPKEIQRYIDIASNSAGNTLSLLDNLLAWNLSKNHFNPIKINLQELVLDVLKVLSSSAESKQITLHSSVPTDLFVIVDAQMVKTIFRNVLNNSIKYSFPGGRVSIIASTERQFIEIVIIDSGIGMSAKAKESLFKTTIRNSVNGTNNEQGSGIGLMLCKEFIEMHGGKISVESELGIGTKTAFTLPRYQNLN